MTDLIVVRKLIGLKYRDSNVERENYISKYYNEGIKDTIEPRLCRHYLPLVEQTYIREIALYCF